MCTQISTTAYSQVSIHAAEWTRATCHVKLTLFAFLYSFPYKLHLRYFGEAILHLYV